MTNGQIKGVVMLTVTAAWLMFFVAGIWRNQPVEVWTWGIPASVYGALYQPWGSRPGIMGSKKRSPATNGGEPDDEDPTR